MVLLAMTGWGIAASLGYFLYTGNQETRKAGGYVKELVSAMQWAVSEQERNLEGVVLYNFSSGVAPTIREYVTTICEVAGIRRYVPNIPYILLLTASHFIELFAKPFGVKHPFNPVRIRKLVKSNDVVPDWLLENGYSYKYDLKSSFQDWKKDKPEDWLVS